MRIRWDRLLVVAWVLLFWAVVVSKLVGLISLGWWIVPVVWISFVPLVYVLAWTAEKLDWYKGDANGQGEQEAS
jgi:hypothetical protein